MFEKGMTLLECLLVLAVVAILVSGVQHGFAPLVGRYQSQQIVYDLYRLSHYARQYAVMLHQTVTLCPSNDGVQCQPQAADWLLFTDPNRNERLDPGEQLLRQYHYSGAWRIRLRLSAGRQYLQFRPIGTAQASAGKLYACKQGDASVHYVTVSLAGRISMKNKEKTPPKGAPVRCG